MKKLIFNIMNVSKQYRLRASDSASRLICTLDILYTNITKTQRYTTVLWKNL